jgi:Rhodopirellula transposase DDE domain
MTGKSGSKLNEPAIQYSSQTGTRLQEQMRQKYENLQWALDERVRRLWAANEAMALGRGGVTLVCQATGLSGKTIALGLQEIRQRQTRDSALELERGRIRRAGAGRPLLTEKYPGLPEALEKLVEPTTRGHPMSPLRWTCKSLRKLAQELGAQGFSISAPKVGSLLGELGYSLQANRKTEEGKNHPDREAQFAHIAQRTGQVIAAGNPVISIDTKKKELLGNFKNPGREWQPAGEPLPVEVHDFGTLKAIPYGIYDIGRNCGWVNVGMDHDTAEFAVESIRRWWKQMGQAVYPQATELLITADAGGSNGYRVRLWKRALQQLADELKLKLWVCHFPPGTSKWNKIEHRMFCHITQNWRGRPLLSYQVVVNLIASTTTTQGLFIEANLDRGRYPKGMKISDQELAQVNLKPDPFHGEWNYSISPKNHAT